jgi:hypothetical protein
MAQPIGGPTKSASQKVERGPSHNRGLGPTAMSKTLRPAGDITGSGASTYRPSPATACEPPAIGLDRPMIDIEHGIVRCRDIAVEQPLHVRQVSARGGRLLLHDHATGFVRAQAASQPAGNPSCHHVASVERKMPQMGGGFLLSRRRNLKGMHAGPTIEVAGKLLTLPNGSLAAPRSFCRRFSGKLGLEHC